MRTLADAPPAILRAALLVAASGVLFALTDGAPTWLVGTRPCTRAAPSVRSDGLTVAFAVHIMFAAMLEVIQCDDRGTIVDARGGVVGAMR